MNEPTTRTTHGLLARAALTVVALIGAFLIVLPLATSLPGKSAASGAMMSAFRPAMTNTALAQAQTDLHTMDAMSAQLQTGVFPAVAAQMNMTPQQLVAYLGTTYPAVGQGLASYGSMHTYFSQLLTTMTTQQANFQQADQIPTGFLPPTSMTLLLVLPGALLLAIGGLGLFRPLWSRRLLAAGGVVGLVMAIALLSVSMYGKASAADTMTAAFKPVFATQSVQQAQTYSNTLQAMETQLTTQAIPGLATALKLTPTQFSGLMTQSYPDVATGLAQFPAIVSRMQAQTGLIAANVDNFNQSAEIPWSPGSMVLMFWFMMGSAGLVLLIGAASVVLTGNRRVFVPRLTPHTAAHS